MANNDQSDSEESFCLLEDRRCDAWRDIGSASPLSILSGVSDRSDDRNILELGGSGDKYISSRSCSSLSSFIQGRDESSEGLRQNRDEEVDHELGSIIRSIMRVPKRKRILHDIIQGDVDELEVCARMLSKRIESYKGGFVIISKHFKLNWEHLHVVHDCNYYNSQCRCAILYGIAVKPRRGSRYCLWSTQCTREYVYNLTVYLCTGERINVQISCGGQTWRCFHSTESVQKRGSQENCSELMVAACEEENECGPSPSGRSCNESTASSSSRKRKYHKEQSQLQRRRPTADSLLQCFKMNLPSPVNNAPQSIQWINTPHLNLISRSNKEFKEAAESYDRWLHIKTLEEIYEILKQGTPMYACLGGNFDKKYYDIENSIQRIEQLLSFQFGQDEDLISSFIQVLYMVLNRETTKKNCIVIIGTVSAGKTLFARLLKTALLSFGQILNMSRYSQFPFKNCINKRILHWDEPSFEPSAIETLKTLFSGDETPANIKHQDFAVIGRTPVIVTTNIDVFPKVSNLYI